MNEGTANRPPEKVVENIVAMCNIAKANGIIPVISSIPPCKAFVWRPEIENAGQTIVDINKSLKAYAETNGLIYVDYHSALSDEDFGFPKTLSEDGCHPDPDTYLQLFYLLSLKPHNRLTRHQPAELHKPSFPRASPSKAKN